MLWQLPKIERARVLKEAEEVRNEVDSLQHDVANLRYQLEMAERQLASAKQKWAVMINTYGAEVVVDLPPSPSMVAVG